ncbi:MAG: LamG domain-containing protein [Woeseiaceae bacterium]|nr:LamG domain-containing protein [Woeseiaceae bacterium]
MIRAIGIAVLASFVLAACGGGAETTELPAPPDSGNNGDTPYTGPVARDGDVLKFQQEFWSNARSSDRCGSCHNETVGQTPMFVRHDDVNMAYDEAVTVVDSNQPSLSRIVEKVASPPTGHNCWVADPGVCGTIMTTWIENWLGDTGGGGRQIVLLPPADIDPGQSPFMSFPTDPALFQQHIHGPILAQYCAGCHSSQSATPQQPYFADPDVASAYEAAKSKINLNTPIDSRFVIKVSPGSQGGEAHNCWNNDCTTASAQMLTAINNFVGSLQPTAVDPSLIYSKGVRLIDGTIASGGNRYENDQVALWEFKTGNGTVAFDSSGVDPAIDLNLSGDVSWYGGWGITIGYDMAQGAGKAQGSTVASKKLHDILVDSGEFSIEAWVIPANVTQEMARIVTYSAGQNSRNFALQQTLYNYDFLLRTNAEDTDGNPLTTLNGDPQLSTPDADEVLQATLQHVVATYNPIDGRSIYVNGVLVTQTDPVPGGTLVPWQDNFALVLGNEASSDGTWEGTFRLAAIHRRALSQEQIQQNFDAGVGERFYLLFDVSERIGAPVQTSYILFEAQQFDTYAYLFDKPHFLTLDGSTPQPVTVEGMRFAMNGLEVEVGQSYSNLVDTLDLGSAVQDELGQPLSDLGAVLPLQLGPADDVFFLTFDNLNGVTYSRTEYPMLNESDYIATDDARKSDVGVKTFDEIDATYAWITGVDRVNYQRGGIFLVDEAYQELRQSLPAVEDPSTFLSSHQVAIAQLAIQYCDAAVEDSTIWSASFFNDPAGTAFNLANRDTFVEPLILRAVGHDSDDPQITSQPSYLAVHSELASYQSGGGLRPDNLIDRLLAGSSDTRAIAKGVCASVLGSAVTLVQ